MDRRHTLAAGVGVAAIALVVALPRFVGVSPIEAAVGVAGIVGWVLVQWVFTDTELTN